MKQAIIRFPHQLFRQMELPPGDAPVYLVEETLFFNQYKFHKQKLWFHRASMKGYAAYLEEAGYEVHYVEAHEENSDVRVLLHQLTGQGIRKFHIADPTDNWLEKRINANTGKSRVHWYDSPLFINTWNDLSGFFRPSNKKFFQTSFYKQQREKWDVLMENGQPKGGKWTYDTENRKKYPKKRTPPSLSFPDTDTYGMEARDYVQSHYPKNPGELTRLPLYPTNYVSAQRWFRDFLEKRFPKFGDYEDALVSKAHYLHHSILSPLLNVGLLEVEEVLRESVEFGYKEEIPINSLEGFIRQILGWREFIRGIYQVKGGQQRTRNFWGHSRNIPGSFYSGTTGIEPVDQTIKKILHTGYAHHIERLMVLSNFMLLCEFDPDQVYRWFMELFIDAYDWVMVPNVYGMGLYADGGLMSTKPYISGSNYLRKMGDYRNGRWQDIWDGLFWNFMHTNRAFFEQNPRLVMLLRNFDRMPADKRERHLETAQGFLQELDRL